MLLYMFSEFYQQLCWCYTIQMTIDKTDSFFPYRWLWQKKSRTWEGLRHREMSLTLKVSSYYFLWSQKLKLINLIITAVLFHKYKYLQLLGVWVFFLVLILIIYFALFYSANVERGAAVAARARVVCWWGGQTNGQEESFSKGMSNLWHSFKATGRK